MSDSLDRRRLGLFLAGLVGGAVSAFLPLTLGPAEDTGPSFGPGLWFGLALGGYFLLIDRPRSLANALIITVASVAAFGLALFATAGPHLMVSSASSAPGPVPLFIGGTVGGSIMGLTTLVLYGKYRTRADLFRRIFMCSIGGGVLGAVGYMFGDALQQGRPSQPTSISVLYFVWQTGFASVLALVWPAPDESVAPALRPGSL